GAVLRDFPKLAGFALYELEITRGARGRLRRPLARSCLRLARWRDHGDLLRLGNRLCGFCSHRGQRHVVTDADVARKARHARFGEFLVAEGNGGAERRRLAAFGVTEAGADAE